MPDLSTATFVKSDMGRAVVAFEGGARATLRIVGSEMPQPNDIVRISRDERGTVVDGLAIPRQPVGTVTEAQAEAGTATVRYDDGRQQTVPALDHVPTLTPGDTVLVFAGHIIGRVRVPPTKEN